MEGLTLWKIVVALVSSLVVIFTAILDYIIRDKRTRQFKILRRILLAIVVLFTIGSCVIIYYDDEQKKDEINALKESLKRAMSNESSLVRRKVDEGSDRIIHDLEAKAKITNIALDRLYATATNAEMQINESVSEIEKLKYPVTDNFYVDFQIKFKDEVLSKLAKEVVAKAIGIDGPDFFFQNGADAYNLSSTSYDSLRYKFFNKFNECSININIGEYPKNLILNHYYSNYTNYFTASSYNSKTDYFNIIVKNLPTKILQKGNHVTSMLDLKNSEFSLNLSFISNQGIYSGQFELHSVAIYMNSTQYINLGNFSKIDRVFIPNSIKFL